MTSRVSVRPASLRVRAGAEPPAGSQRVGGLVEIPALLRELGADPVKIFGSVELRLSDFENTEARTPYVGIGRLLGACAAATRCEHFGMLAGARWRLAHLGIVGELMRHAPTVGAALRFGAAHQWLNAAGGVPFLFERGRIAEVGYGIYLSDVHFSDQVHDLVMALEVQLIREFCGASWKPSRVFLPRSEPLEAKPYLRFFGAPVRFDAGYAAFEFPASVFARALPDANPAKAAELEHNIVELGPEELVPRLRRALRVMLAFGDTSGDHLADRLSMHRRTLNRRLAAAGTSFQDVLDDVRFAVARQMLETSSLPLVEIADALGYSESSSFVRAFCRWSGSTPTGWRQSRSSRRIHRK